MKGEKEAGAPRNFTTASAVGMTTNSATGDTKKVIPGTEDLALSDAVWLRMKRKKDLGAADEPTSGRERDDYVVTPSTVGRPQLAEHPGGARSGTMSDLGFKSMVTGPKPNIERPMGRCIHHHPRWLQNLTNLLQKYRAFIQSLSLVSKFLSFSLCTL